MEVVNVPTMDCPAASTAVGMASRIVDRKEVLVPQGGSGKVPDNENHCDPDITLAPVDYDKNTGLWFEDLKTNCLPKQLQYILKILHILDL